MKAFYVQRIYLLFFNDLVRLVLCLPKLLNFHAEFVKRVTKNCNRALKKLAMSLSFAYDICKAKTSARWAALHISPAHARGDLPEINQQLQHVARTHKNTILAV